MDEVQNALELQVSHIRAFRSKIAACRPTEKEAEALDNAGVTNARARSYLVWRRSCLVVASPFVSTSVILGLVGLRDLSTESSRNGLGNLMIILTGIDTLFMSIGMSLSMHLWSRATLSMRSLRYGWLASFVLPLIPALFPLEMLFKKDELDALEEELGEEAYDAYILVVKLTWALRYAIQLLPVVITFPGGAVRGATKILGLLPLHSTLPAWILIVAAPFYSLLVCVALVIVAQVAGNGTLFFGTLFMVAAPLVYLVRGRMFLQDKSTSQGEQREFQLNMTQKASAILTAVGICLLVIWAFTAESNGIRVLGHRNNKETASFLTWGNGLRMVFEMIGRLLVTTILFSDIVLAMSISHWREERNMKRSQSSEIDMVQLNSIMFGAAPIDPGPVTTADTADVPPPLSFAFAGETENAEEEEEEEGHVDDVSSYGDEEEDMSV